MTILLTPPPTVEKNDRKIFKNKQYHNTGFGDDDHDNNNNNSTTVVDSQIEDKNKNIVPKSLLQKLREVENKKSNKYIKPFYTIKKNKPSKNSILDLNNNNNRTISDSKELSFLKSVLNDCSNIILITGAGISTNAGIPDFRSNENGLFKQKQANSKVKDNKSLFDINSIYSSNEYTLQFNKLIKNLHNLSQSIDPTPFHYLLDKLLSRGQIKRIYTQNIDSLETKLDSFKELDPIQFFTHLPTKPPYPKLIQLHGSINYTQCNKCHQIKLLDPNDFITEVDTFETERDPILIPHCSQCQEYEEIRKIAGVRSKGIGLLRPKIILYNEIHPDGDEIASIINYDIKSKKIDCLMIVGTTLEIPGVRNLVKGIIKNMRPQRLLGKFVVIFISNELPNNNIIKLFEDDGIDLIVHGDCQDLVNLV